jgi:hypothetical protein
VRNGTTETLKVGTHDKGHDAEVAAFVDAVRRGAPSPVALESLVATTLASFAAVEALRTGEPVDLMDDLRAFGVVV